MTDSLRNMPRYIRQTDVFGWQGADGPNGPWRSIAPPQSGTPWQTTNPMDDLRQASADVSGVEVLSPAAQAVLDAYESSYTESGLVAALRAAVDLVLPLYMCSLGSTRGTTRLGVRQKFLAIAAELEGAQ